MRRLVTPKAQRVNTRVLSKEDFDRVVQGDAQNWRDTAEGSQLTGIYFHPLTQVGRSKMDFCFFNRQR